MVSVGKASVTGARLGSRSLALIIAVAALWGAPYLLIAIAVKELAPVVVVAARCAVAAVALLAIAGPARLRSLRRRHLPWIGVLAVLEFAAPFTLVAIGEQSVPSALAGILIAAAPLFIAIMAPLLDRAETPGGRQGVGLVTGFAGVMLLMGLDVADASLLGGLLILIAAMSYGSTSFVLTLKLSEVHPLTIVGTATAGATLGTAIPAVLSLPDHAPSATALWALLLLGLACTAAGFSLFVTLNARIGPARSSVVVYLAPVVAVLLGVLVLDEPFTGTTALGLVLVLTGSWLAASTRARSTTPHRELKDPATPAGPG